MKKGVFFIFLYLFFNVGIFAQSNGINFIITGGVTASSVSINAQLFQDANDVQGVVATDSFFITNAQSSNIDTANLIINNRICHFFVDSLLPNTHYYYRIIVDGLIDLSPNALGQFNTPDTGNFSFRIVIGGCTQNNFMPFYDSILNTNPLLFIQNGDFHYQNINSPLEQDYRNAFDTYVFASPYVKKFTQKIPLVYMWDDHDYCSNDLGGDSLDGALAVRKNYRNYFPHYPLLDTSQAIYQSFNVGRICFIITDLRSHRNSSSLMGLAQKQWFKNEILQAYNQSKFIVWVSSVSYSGNVADNWGGYPVERTEIADFLNQNNINQLMIICGDAHMLGMDNGNNTDFSTSQNNPNKYPLLQSAALLAYGSYKGGTFSEGYFPNPDNTYGQYSVLDFNDNGSTICVNIDGKRISHTLGNISTIFNYQFCRPTAVNTVFAKDNNQLQLFPNPTKDKIYCKLLQPLNHIQLVEVYNQLGQYLASTSITQLIAGYEVKHFKNQTLMFKIQGRFFKVVVN